MDTARACSGSFPPIAITIGDIMNTRYASVPPSCNTLIAPICNTDEVKQDKAVPTPAHNAVVFDVLDAFGM